MRQAEVAELVPTPHVGLHLDLDRGPHLLDAKALARRPSCYQVGTLRHQVMS